MAEPNTPQDVVFYDKRDFHLLRDINLYIESQASVNIWGQFFVNGLPFNSPDSIIDVTTMGAEPDYDLATQTMLTDSTDAFADAVAACPVGGAVFVPPAPTGKAWCGKVDISKPISFGGYNRIGCRIVPPTGSSGDHFKLSWNGGSPLGESHEFGVYIHDLYLDGTRRTPDINGLVIDIHDRVVLERLQVKNYKRSGIKCIKTVREGEWRSIYMRRCGDIDYPSLDVFDDYVGDGSNNLVISDSKFLESFGPMLRIEKSGGVAARSIFFKGCMIHGFVPSIIEGQAFLPIDDDGYAYPVTGRELESMFIDLASVRDIFFSDCRIHSSGYGQPLIMCRESATGPVTAKFFSVSNSSLGDTNTRSLASVSVAGNIFTKVDHHLGTGALVRVTGTSLSSTTDFWVIRLSANTFSLASTRANAVLGTAVVVTDDPDCTVTCRNRVADLDVPSVGNGRAMISNSFALGTAQEAVIINRTTDPSSAVTSNVLTTTGVQVEQAA